MTCAFLPRLIQITPFQCEECHDLAPLQLGAGTRPYMEIRYIMFWGRECNVWGTKCEVLHWNENMIFYLTFLGYSQYMLHINFVHRSPYFMKRPHSNHLLVKLWPVWGWWVCNLVKIYSISR